MARNKHADSTGDLVYWLAKQLMVTRLGKDPKKCEQCPAEGVEMNVHHTKYDGATLYDLQFVCTACNTSVKNCGLI